MAPSPTGEYHIGHMRTLLYNWAWARKNRGEFIIRIEDTDQERKVPGAVEEILSVIRDYGFSWDEGPDVGGPCGPYVQSERLAVYKEKAEELVAKGWAYYCFCSKERLEELRKKQQVEGGAAKYDGRCRNLGEKEVEERLEKGETYVVRLRVPEGRRIVYEDLVMGEVEGESEMIDDQVLLKGDGYPTYHLAAVVDDHLMEISHVLRGSEWISSTPKHLLLYEAFSWEPPKFGHLPVFLDPSGGKMSKRKGSVAARAFLEEGYLPEAMVNFVALLGWTHPEEKEVFSRDEFVEKFDVGKIHKANPMFDRKKLDWLNGLYIRQMGEGRLVEKLERYLPSGMSKKLAVKVLPLIKDRLVKLSDFGGLTEFVVRRPDLDRSLFEEGWKEQLEAAADILEKVEWNERMVDERLQEMVIKRGWKMGKFFMNLRVAVCGSRTTPPLTGVMMVLGRNEILARIAEGVKI